MEKVAQKPFENVSFSVTEVLSRIRKHQNEVRDLMRDKYVEFLSNANNYRMLLDSAKLLEVEIKELVNSTSQLTVDKSSAAWNDLCQYQRDLEEGVRGYKIAKKLLSIHDLFETLSLTGNAYEKRAHILAKIKLLLDDVEDPVLPELHCFQSLLLRYEIEYSELINDLNANFNKLVTLQQRTFQNTKSVTIKICKDEVQLCQVVVALLKTQHDFRSLCRFLLDEVFAPVIVKPVSLICDEKSDDEHAQIQLSYQLTVAEELRPGYKTVLSNLMQIFYNLSNMNAVLSEDECLFKVLARQMKKKLCEMLIEQCLERDIPGTIEGMKESPMVKDVSDFNGFLTTFNFIDGENDSQLEEYASSIESIHHKKLCDNVLDSAVEIMKRESHDMVVIEQHEYQFASSTSTVTGQSSSCMVTRTAVELKKFLDKVLTEVQTQHGEAAERLVKTIATILERYTVDVPMANEKLLFKIPQQSALFRNDCSYLNYWLQKNDDKLKDHCSFACISESLKTCGEDIFQHQLSSQRTQMLQALNGFELTNSLVELGSEHQRAIRQCIRQFELLKNVWQTVLPDGVYKQNISGLVDVFLREVIKRVQSLEDITTAIGNGLVLLIDTMKETLPKLFKEPSEVHQLVKQWTKLMQLRQILCGSLVEITEQWAEGKGPLTMCFSAEEVKHLVRALFQNTKQRQACIASIV
ncbi:centromere/kinetochore protein zw10 [Anopheles aquasalis]|uniref:centromere/kinetochore protein zw10 n=1 Tax=Anopheles aquasalis TaxID=42839 RepID=UPI00215AD3F5|nr:centromere/kinetochore protein zw10 [Anopheles aquasalis]